MEPAGGAAAGAPDAALHDVVGAGRPVAGGDGGGQLAQRVVSQGDVQGPHVALRQLQVGTA